jgi:hypothetical protein
MNPEKDIENQLEQLAQAIPSGSSFVDGVMSRLETSSDTLQKQTIHINLVRRLFMKTTFKFAAAAIILIAAFLSLTIWDKGVPNVMASEVLTSAIEAVQNIHSIYIKAKMRTLPQDNFMYLNLELDFVPIEMWKKQCDDGQLRVRVDKPRRQVVFDNTMGTMIINHNYVVQGRHRGGYGSYDSRWLTRLLWVDNLLKSELQMAQDDPKHEITVYHDTINGSEKLVVERFSRASVSMGDYLRDKFIDDSDHTLIYYFNPNTKLLEGLKIIVHTNGKDILAFEITDIFYNPEIADSHFTLEIPKDAIYHKEPQILPDNEKYVNMSPKEVAQTFFAACAEENWEEFLNFWTSNRADDQIKQHLGGLEIVSIGEPFQSGGYGGWFVPYEIKLKNGEIKKHNLAIRNDNPAKRWVFDGGL